MGKNRKIRKITWTMCILLSATAFLPVQAPAATIKAPYRVEQAYGKAPEVTAYMTGSKVSENVSVSGSVGDIGLTQEGDAVPFGNSSEGLNYIILLDNSGSVNEDQFEETRSQLIKLRKSLGDNDGMTLYTVGTDDAGGEKTEVFTAEGADSVKKDVKKIKKISYMSTRESMTVLYRSLNEVLASLETPKKRTIVLLITDGEDDSAGKDIDNVSTAKEVKDASVPVYGIILQNNMRTPNAEKIDYTRNEILAEKNCRGYYSDCSLDGSTESVDNAFQTLNQIFREQTYVVRLCAETNRTAGKAKLELTADDTAVDPIEIDYSSHEEDTEAPALSGDITRADDTTITFDLTDENGIRLEDVKDKSHYTIRFQNSRSEEEAKADDASDAAAGKEWQISDVKVSGKGKTVSVQLSLDQELYNGNYTLTCKGIRDDSEEANAMDTTTWFEITDGKSAAVGNLKNWIRSYWWIILIAAVVVVGLLVMRILKNRPEKIVEVDPDSLTKADTKQIRLTITDRSGAIKDVEWNVEGSLFIGRSDICNIYFDDDRLSKQHFVVEVTKMGCYIEDLESTNGTYVNGVKMTNRRMLLDGDVITAGREKFVFHIPKNQPVPDTDEDDE